HREAVGAELAFDLAGRVENALPCVAHGLTLVNGEAGGVKGRRLAAAALTGVDRVLRPGGVAAGTHVAAAGAARRASRFATPGLLAPRTRPGREHSTRRTEERRMRVGYAGVIGIVVLAALAFAAVQRRDEAEITDVLLRVNGPLHLAAGDSARTVVVIGHDADVE